MPYKIDDPDLPSNVKEMPEDKRKQWVETFNSAYDDCIEEGGEECDGEAMRIANASINDRVRRWITKLLIFLGFGEKEKPDKNRAVSLNGAIEQIYSGLVGMLDDEYAWVNDVYMDDTGTFLLCSSKGKLYRVRLNVSGENVVTLGSVEEVAIDFVPSSLPDAEDEEPIELSRMIIRQEGEQWRWLSISSVSVLNRGGEIDSRELFDSFVDYAERTGEYPIRQFYHSGEVFRTGKADFLARVGYALITSGLYDDTDLARAEVAARQAEPGYWGDSIGFSAEEPEMFEVQSGISIPVYKTGILREISTLPEQDACAWFTNLTSVEVIRMNNRQFEAFVKLFGGDEEKARKWLEENPEALNRQIDAAGMLARSVENVDEHDVPVVEAEPVQEPAVIEPRTVELDDAALQVIIDRAVAQMQGNIAPIAENLQTFQENWTANAEAITRKIDELTAALTAHSTRLDSLEADKAETDRNKIMDMPKSSLKVTYRPRDNGGSAEPEKPADKVKELLDRIPNKY